MWLKNDKHKVNIYILFIYISTLDKKSDLDTISVDTIISVLLGPYNEYIYNGKKLSNRLGDNFWLLASCLKTTIARNDYLEEGAYTHS